MITTLDSPIATTVSPETAAANPATELSPIVSLDHTVLADLEVKEKRLSEIRAELKTEFFGIDCCIDAVMESIKTWYLFHQIIQRPGIIPLWGLTGVGKTALVRSLVSKLGFSNRFVEIQMDTMSLPGSDSFRSSSICSILQGSSIQEGQPGIIFLDEFQRFKTLNERGEDLKSERYQDVWMLLSDGRFSSDYSFMGKIERELAQMESAEDNDLYWKAEQEARQETRERKEKRDKEREAAKKAAESSAAADVVVGSGFLLTHKSDSPPPVENDDASITVLPKYKRRFSLYVYEAETFKKLLRLSEPVIEIMKWPKEKIRTMVAVYASSHRSDTIDYTKCLIFIGGNLDEAFQMSNSVADCDTSADVFYEHTKKISSIEIKKALGTRFRPEQIARLGNNHVIYPSLNSAAYMAIIKRSCAQYIEDARKVCQIDFKVNDSVYQEIYDNSVYPAQGTRPVFTSIHKLFGSPLSDAILWGLRLGVDEVSIDLDAAASSLIFTSPPDHRKVVHIDFDIRARRQDRSADFEALIAVHEAGHALVFADLFKRTPLEISINPASFKGGYNLFDPTASSKTDLLHSITTLMGGLVAEEMVFGPELRSTGSESDIGRATAHAGHYVRRHAMDGFASTICPSPSYNLNHNLDDSDPIIESIVKERREEAKTVLTRHRGLLIKLSRELIRVKKMSGKVIIEFLDGAIPGLSTKRIVDVTGDYAARLEGADL